MGITPLGRKVMILQRTNRPTIKENHSALIWPRAAHDVESDRVEHENEDVGHASESEVEPEALEHHTRRGPRENGATGGMSPQLLMMREPPGLASRGSGRSNRSRWR